jgi:RNA polymerase sigma-70 factor (ECF subfamily)
MREGDNEDLETFEQHRPTLLSLAYRMLGDLSRAEDMVQEAWMRWQRRPTDVSVPKAFLLTVVTRLCLDELTSARARREEMRGDQLPEPVDLDESGIGQVEAIDQVSMAFLVLLQRLSPAERAVLILHDVFDVDHAEIGTLLGRTEVSCRKLLSRAREGVASERRALETSREEHRRLLMAFMQAVRGGEPQPLLDLLAEEAVLVVDPGPEGAGFGRIRAAGRPVVGARRIAALLHAIAKERSSRAGATSLHERELNGQPAIVVLRDGRPVSAILVSVVEGRIRAVFVQSDRSRLTHLGPLN